MTNKNICKFIPAVQPETLYTQCFILESNRETMQCHATLSFHRAFLIRQGTGQFSFSGEIVPFSTGSLVFGFSGESILVLNPSFDCEYMYIDFEGPRANRLFQRFAVHKHNRIFSNFDGAVPYWFDSLNRASESSIDLAAESMLLYAFSRLASTLGKQNDLILKMTEITEQHFTDPNLSLAYLSESLSYNPKYLSHLFKKKMGIGYTEYLRTIRLKYAVSLLDHGIDSVKNVAFLSGFSDPLYFSNVFKEYIGTSPKEYRKRSNIE